MVGTKNKHVMHWIDTHQAELDQSNVKLALITGLTHNQEFTQIDVVFPIIQPFFAENY